MANMTLTSKIDGAAITIKNAALRTETKRIINALNDAKNSLYTVAFILNKINEGKLYAADGFADIYDYGNIVFGYKRAMVNNMIRVGSNYLTSDGKGVKSLMAHSDSDYTVSQMQELLTIPVEDAKQLDADGKINPDMTTKEIRNVVADYRKSTPAAKAARTNKVTEKQIESAYNRAADAIATIARAFGDDEQGNALMVGILTDLESLCEIATKAVQADKAAKKPAKTTKAKAADGEQA